jgi:dTDP-glucose pyrophosphorylase
MAAGMGSRYGGLKQIDPVGPSGETLMDYSIYDAIRAGFGKLVFIIRKDIEAQFKEFIGTRYEKRIPVEYVYQELDKIPAGFTIPEGRTKPWGTTQAILMSTGVIHEPFAVINADDFYGAEGYRALAAHLTSGTPDLAMVGFTLRNTLSDFGSVARGVCRVNSENYLEYIEELTKVERDGAEGAAKNTDPAGNVTKLTGNEAVSMNMWGFTPQVFGLLEQNFLEFLRHSGSELKSECYIPNTVGALVTSGKARVKVLPTNDSWFGVTYRQDHATVVENINRLVQAGIYPQRLWS